MTKLNGIIAEFAYKVLRYVDLSKVYFQLLFNFYSEKIYRGAKVSIWPVRAQNVPFL